MVFPWSSIGPFKLSFSMHIIMCVMGLEIVVFHAHHHACHGATAVSILVCLIHRCCSFGCVPQVFSQTQSCAFSCLCVVAVAPRDAAGNAILQRKIPPPFTLLWCASRRFMKTVTRTRDSVYKIYTYGRHRFFFFFLMHLNRDTRKKVVIALSRHLSPSTTSSHNGWMH